MFQTAFRYVRKPALILIYSFLLGLLFDAFAEQLNAQERSSRKTWAPRTAARPVEDSGMSNLQELVEDNDSQADDLQEVESDLENRADQLKELEREKVVAETANMASDGLSDSIMSLNFRVVDSSSRKPEDQSIELTNFGSNSNYPGTHPDRVAMWCPANIRYQPLYFEEVGLERYGYHYDERLQPAVSAMQFGKSFFVLPWRMYRNRPDSCTYPLGFCRPGSLAPETERRLLR